MCVCICKTNFKYSAFISFKNFISQPISVRSLSCFTGSYLVWNKWNDRRHVYASCAITWTLKGSKKKLKVNKITHMRNPCKRYYSTHLLYSLSVFFKVSLNVQKYKQMKEHNKKKNLLFNYKHTQPILFCVSTFHWYTECQSSMNSLRSNISTKHFYADRGVLIHIHTPCYFSYV